MKDLYQESLSANRQGTVNPYGMYGYGTGMPPGMTPGMGAAPAFPQPAPYAPFFPPQPSGATIPGVPAAPGVASYVPGMLPLEESYIENILRLNKGKMGTFYFTYENNNQWNAKVYKGVIEAAGRDHLIISDPQTGTRYLLLMVNFDYATFEGELNYEYPVGAPRPRPISPR